MRMYSAVQAVAGQGGTGRCTGVIRYSVFVKADGLAGLQEAAETPSRESERKQPPASVQL